MSFKPKVAKTITSAVIGLVLGLLSAEFGIFQKSGDCSSGICVDYGISLLPILVIFIISTLIIYTIWSLSSKK